VKKFAKTACRIGLKNAPEAHNSTTKLFDMETCPNCGKNEKPVSI
jgi:hypothetical protein